MAHTLLPRTRVRFPSICLAALVFVSCQKPATSFEPTPTLTQGVRFSASNLGAPTVTVQFQSAEQALAPLRLNALTVMGQAGVEQEVELTVPFSTRGMWARVFTPPQEFTLGNAKVAVADHALVYFPVVGRKLRFTPSLAGRVVLEPFGGIDTLGGGFEVSSAPEQTLEVTTASRLSDSVQAVLPDDTFFRVVTLEASAATDAQLVIGKCGAGSDVPTTADEILEVSASRKLRVVASLPPGPLCVSTNAAARLNVKELGRARRFATTSLRAVVPATVLDTRAGVAWLGVPDDGQELRVSLAQLQGEGANTHRLLSVTIDDDAEATVGACDKPLPTKLRGTGLLLLANANSLCITPGKHHVQVKEVAVVTERSDAVSCSAATRAPAVQCAATDFLGKLNCIPGLSAESYTSQRPRPGAELYLLRLQQPVDHFKPDGAKFEQRILLTLRDPAAPVVLATTGYELFDYRSDLASNFPVNELEVEHRFFEDSTPSPVDYGMLTIMQSAADSHHIVEALGALLPGPWMSTGHSKGGMTALFHRRFYPCDVAASAPYVTPISHGKLDPRFGPWLAQLGGPRYDACRGVLKDLERGVISRRAELAPGLRGHYTMIGSQVRALWAASNGETLWGAFQYGRQDDTMRGCPAYEALIGSPDFPYLVEQYSGYGEYYADEYLTQGQLDSYSYQTQNELGSPGANRAHLEEFGPIPDLPDDAIFLFGSVPVPAFEPRAMDDIQQWLSKHGERFVFLYGEWDPWTGAQVDVTGARETVKVIIPEANHGLGLTDLSGPEREQVFTMLEGWLGVSRNPKRKVSELRANEPLEYRDVMHRHRL
ncbi:MAG: S28 family serine protease [Archangium sp.]